MKKMFLLATFVLFGTFITKAQKDFDSVTFKNITEKKILAVDSLLERLRDCLFLKKTDGISPIATDTSGKKYQTLSPHFSCDDRFFSVGVIEDSLGKKNYRAITFKNVIFGIEKTEGFLIELSARPSRISYVGMREISYSFTFSKKALGFDIISKNNYTDEEFLKEVEDFENFLIKEIQTCENFH